MTTITGQFRPAKPVVAAPPPPPARRERLARMLALAHRVEQLVEGGEVESYAVVARALGLTRARMTQVMNLLLLGPELQERVIFGDRGVTARGVRRAVREADWGRREGENVRSHRAPERTDGAQSEQLVHCAAVQDNG